VDRLYKINLLFHFVVFLVEYKLTKIVAEIQNTRYLSLYLAKYFIHVFKRYQLVKI